MSGPRRPDAAGGPGTAGGPGAGDSCGAADEPCATCGDVADPMLVLARAGGDARVRRRDGAETTVAVDLVPGAGPGTVVLVHQGVAIGTIGDVTGDAFAPVRAPAHDRAETTR